MSPLEEWREMAARENRRMRLAYADPTAKVADKTRDPRVKAANERRAKVMRLHQSGMGPTAIGRDLGVPTTTIATDLKHLRSKGMIE